MTRAHSLGLPTKAPPCFDSQADWNDYRAAAECSAGDGFTYCADCTAPRQAKMIAAGRCKHPGTVFVIHSGTLVGRRRKADVARLVPVVAQPVAARG